MKSLTIASDGLLERGTDVSLCIAVRGLLYTSLVIAEVLGGVIIATPLRKGISERSIEMLDLGIYGHRHKMKIIKKIKKPSIERKE